MRENMGIYRGQTKGGEWVEGYFAKTILSNGELIYEIRDIEEEHRLACYTEVLPETVGEWTGLTDKNGKRIFEGDIVFADFCESEDTLNDFSFTGTYVVKWGDDNYPSFDTDPWIDCECNGLMFLIDDRQRKADRYRKWQRIKDRVVTGLWAVLIVGFAAALIVWR